MMNNQNIAQINDELLLNNAIILFKSLSNEKLNQAYDFIKYLHDKDEWEATKELDSEQILNLK